MNSAGDFCGKYNIDDIGFTCTSSTTCSPRCRDLLTTTRDQLGCCVNALNRSRAIRNSDLNYGYNPFYYPSFGDPFRYSLWSICGVETVTEKCAATFDLSNIDIDPECTNNDLDNRVNFRVFCKSQFRESTINALRAAGCPDEFSDDDSPNRCLAREDGQYCESMVSCTPFFLQCI